MLKTGYLTLAILAGMATQVADAQTAEYPSELYQVVMQCRSPAGNGKIAVHYCALTGEITNNGNLSAVDAGRAYAGLIQSQIQGQCAFIDGPTKIGGTETCPPGETAFRRAYWAQ
jgi:hypothetical protein